MSMKVIKIHVLIVNCNQHLGSHGMYKTIKQNSCCLENAKKVPKFVFSTNVRKRYLKCFREWASKQPKCRFVKNVCKKN